MLVAVFLTGASCWSLVSGGKSSMRNGRLEANGRRSQNKELRKAKTDQNGKSLVFGLLGSFMALLCLMGDMGSFKSLGSHRSPVSHGCHGSFRFLESHGSPLSHGSLLAQKTQETVETQVTQET